jgi:hypothetical protein
MRILLRIFLTTQASLGPGVAFGSDRIFCLTMSRPTASRFMYLNVPSAFATKWPSLSRISPSH